MENPESLLRLDPIEIRVLGSLIEKSKTTPEYYPITPNALVLACNQKTSRKPLVHYDEETVMQALNTLAKKGLVSTATGAGNRIIKYKHNFTILYPVSPGELAVLCLLFLRGPLTPGEINSNSSRLHPFDSLAEVLRTLEKLKQGHTPFIALMPKHPGQKEQRFRQLFCELQEPDQEPPQENPLEKLEARLETMERDMAELKSLVQKIWKEWAG
jgi:uncharacterized protein